MRRAYGAAAHHDLVTLDDELVPARRASTPTALRPSNSRRRAMTFDLMVRFSRWRAGSVRQAILMRTPSRVRARGEMPVDSG